MKLLESNLTVNGVSNHNIKIMNTFTTFISEKEGLTTAVYERALRIAVKLKENDQYEPLKEKLRAKIKGLVK